MHNFFRRLRNTEAVAGSSPAPAPAPAPEIPQINSQADAEEFVKSWTPEQVDAFLTTGKMPGQEAPAPANPADPPAPPAPPAEPKPEAKEGQEPPADPDALTTEVIEQAHPAMRKLYDDHVATLEKLVDIEGKLEAASTGLGKYKDDPIMKARSEALERGDVEVPLVFDLGVDTLKLVKSSGLLDALAKETDDEAAEKLVAATVDSALKTAIKEMSVRAQANIEIGREEAIRIGEDRAEFRNQFVRIAESVPEWKSDKPILIEKDGRKVVNPEHPAREFMNWIGEQASAGALTDAAAKAFGMDALFHIWKSRQAGGMGAHMASVKRSAAQEALDRMRGLKRTVLTQGAAPTVGAQQPTASGRTQFHGFVLEELLANPDMATKAINHWGKNNPAALDEFMSKFNQ